MSDPPTTPENSAAGDVSGGDQPRIAEQPSADQPSADQTGTPEQHGTPEQPDAPEQPVTADQPGAAGGPSGADGRRAKRRPFPFRQRVAFGVWEGTPPDEAFIDVTFRDVSASGCSFTVVSRPTEEKLLVHLGTENHRVAVQASVVHVTPQTTEGKETYLIGCRFLRRLE